MEGYKHFSELPNAILVVNPNLFKSLSKGFVSMITSDTLILSILRSIKYGNPKALFAIFQRQSY